MSLSLSLLAKQQGLTPAKARESPQVSWLFKHDPDGLAEAVSNMLIYTSQLINCPRNLTNFQVLVLAQQLPERYWRWHIDEFAFVFKEAVAGVWGKVYDRLDPAIVHEWCAQYETQVQCQLMADEAESKAAIYKVAEADTSALHDMGRAYLCELLKNFTNDDLKNNLNECQLRPDAPNALINKELSEDILAKREKAKAAGPTHEQREADYQRVKASHFTKEVLKQGPPEVFDQP
jgi:hypothetical protein